MLTKEQQSILQQAEEILSNLIQRDGYQFTAPADTIQYCKVALSPLEYEVFGVLYLDNKHRLISFDKMFRGTIDSTSVYPREVAKSALQHNSAAVIFTHNHPSGEPEPSIADRSITERLVAALGLLDIRVLDHIVVAGNRHTSFAEQGLL